MGCVLSRRAAVGIFFTALAGAKPSGRSRYEAFTRWRRATGRLDWEQAVTEYRKKLKADGMHEASIDAAMRAIDSYGEAELYDGLYAGAPEFNTKPNELLVQAITGRRPGKALDVGMGQGRNSVFLAERGWSVNGFDVSQVGLRKARELAGSKGVKITTVFSSDEDFDFGRNRWNLIAIIYGIEKRSVVRARNALTPGGIIVVEAGHKSASGAPFEYASGELTKMFHGFRIIKYEEPLAVPDWTKEPIRLVRLVAEKPM